MKESESLEEKKRVILRAEILQKKDDGSEKVFTRKKRNVESPKRSKPRQNPKDASSEKSAMVEDRKSGPSKTDLRKTICEILKEVDFNTIIFLRTDLVKQLLRLQLFCN
ncbi:hypothetical protein HPP92_028360 [Vanilla planifolia]|uniref:Uncharacterized protein n=1 Tax=Vanilla planifolia TaxID=51239 RepID=A0A835P900_VANPL|nr:hypothetical protein HPP92_028360 [Vanilla planifolia]